VNISTPVEALRRVGDTHRRAELELLSAEPKTFGWIVTFREDVVIPPGSPSYLVLRDGRVEAIGTRESISAAYERVKAQPLPT
jgi:hypothetical protein